MSHEEKYDAAIGSAMLAGTVTGLITVGFGAIGKGGFEDAFFKGMTYRQTKGVVDRMRRVKFGLKQIVNRETMEEATGRILTELTGRSIKKWIAQSPTLKGFLDEAMEEGLDDFVQSFIRDAALDEDTPLWEKAKGAAYGGLVGGIIGAGAAKGRAIVDDLRGGTANEARYRAQLAEDVITKLREEGSPLTADEWAIRETRRQLTAPERDATRRVRPPRQTAQGEFSFVDELDPRKPDQFQALPDEPVPDPSDDPESPAPEGTPPLQVGEDPETGQLTMFGIPYGSDQYVFDFMQNVDELITPENVADSLEEQLEFELGLEGDADSGSAGAAVRSRTKTKKATPDGGRTGNAIDNLRATNEYFQGKDYIFPTSPAPLTKTEFIDDHYTAAEVAAFEQLVSNGVVVDLTRDRMIHGMPDRKVVPKDYYEKKTQLLKELINIRYPKITTFLRLGRPVKDKTGKIIGYTDKDGIGIFDNVADNAAALMAHGIPVKAPTDATHVNPAFLFSEGSPIIEGVVIDGGFSGTKVMRLNRTEESLPSYDASLNKTGNLLNLFVDNERPVTTGNRKLINDGPPSTLSAAGGEVPLNDLRQQLRDFFTKARTEGSPEQTLVRQKLLAPDKRARVTSFDIAPDEVGPLQEDVLERAVLAFEQDAHLMAIFFELNQTITNTPKATVVNRHGAIEPTHAAVEILKERLNLKGRDAADVILGSLPIKGDPNSSPDKILSEFLRDFVLNDPLLQKNSVNFKEVGSRVINRFVALQQKYLSAESKFFPSKDPSKRFARLVDPNVARTFDPRAVDMLADLINDASEALEAEGAVAEIDESVPIYDFAGKLVREPAKPRIRIRKALDEFLAIASGNNMVWSLSHDEALGMLLRDTSIIQTAVTDSAKGQAFVRLYKLARRTPEASPLHMLLRLVNGVTDLQKEGDVEQDTRFVEHIKSRIEATMGRTFSVPQTLAVIRSIRRVSAKLYSFTPSESEAPKLSNVEQAERLKLSDGDPESVINAFENLRKNSKNATQRKTARILLGHKDLIRKTSFTLNTWGTSFGGTLPDREGIAGEFHYSHSLEKGTVAIYTKSDPQDVAATLLHEYVHALTYGLVHGDNKLLTREQRKAVDNLYRVLRKARELTNYEGGLNEELGTRNNYALSNIDEFIAHTFTSPEFQGFLKSRKFQQDRTLFQAFIDSLFRLFSVDIKSKETDLFTEALAASVKLTDSIKKNGRISARSVSSEIRANAALELKSASDASEAIPSIAAEEDEGITFIRSRRNERRLESQAGRADEEATKPEDALPEPEGEVNTEENANVEAIWFWIAKKARKHGVSPQYFQSGQAGYEAHTGTIAFAKGREGSAYFNLSQIRYLLRQGKSVKQVKRMMRGIVEEEIAHIASFRSISEERLATIINETSDETYIQIADDYYQSEESKALSKERLASEDPSVVLDEKENLIEEMFRIKAQRAMRGVTSEESFHFWKENPNLFKQLMHYLGALVTRLKALRAQNRYSPELSLAISNLVEELHVMRGGERLPASVYAFNPDAPDEVISQLMGGAPLESDLGYMGIDPPETGALYPYPLYLDTPLYDIGFDDEARVGTAKLGTVKNPIDTPQTSNIGEDLGSLDDKAAKEVEAAIRTQLKQITASQRAKSPLNRYGYLPPDFLNRRNPRQRVAALRDWMADNLISLFSQVPPEIRKRSMRWYDGANRIAHGLAKKYGVTPKQVAGVMAVLSPQKDWFLNLAQAEQVLETWTNYQNFKMEGTAFDDLLEATINKAEAPVNQKRGKSAAERKQLDKNARDKRRRLFAHLKGKTLKEIQEMGGKRGNILRGWAVRLISEHMFGTGVSITSPEGNPVGVYRNEDGKPRVNAWGSARESNAAIEILLDGSAESINEHLGDKHKVRSFYNNIISPLSAAGDVTIDTHAVAAAFLMPYSQKALPVSHNFGSASSSPKNGLNGTYHIIAEAYRKAAKSLGVQPRQLQSVTWEAIRGMYDTASRKDLKFMESRENVWKENDTDAARTELTGQTIRDPFWVRRGDIDEAYRVERAIGRASQRRAIARRGLLFTGRAVSRSIADLGVPDFPDSADVLRSDLGVVADQAADEDYNSLVMGGDSGTDNLQALLDDAGMPSFTGGRRQALVDEWVERNPKTVAQLNLLLQKRAWAMGYDSDTPYYHASPLHDRDTPTIGGVTQLRRDVQTAYNDMKSWLRSQSSGYREQSEVIDDPTVYKWYIRKGADASDLRNIKSGEVIVVNPHTNQIVPLRDRYSDHALGAQYAPFGYGDAPYRYSKYEAGPERMRILDTPALEAVQGARGAQEKLDQLYDKEAFWTRKAEGGSSTEFDKPTAPRRDFLEEVPDFVTNYERVQEILRNAIKETGEVSREEMPIIQPNEMEAFAAFATEQLGKEVTVVPEQIPAAEVRPHQTELFFPKTVWYAMQMYPSLQEATAELLKKPFSLTTSDNFVLDGNHRWGQVMLITPDASITSGRVNLTMEEVLPVAKAFTEMTGATRATDRGGETLRSDLGETVQVTLEGSLERTGILMLKPTGALLAGLAARYPVVENLKQLYPNWEALSDDDVHITLAGSDLMKLREQEGKTEDLSVPIPPITVELSDPQVAREVKPDGTVKESLFVRIIEQEPLRDLTEKILGEPTRDTNRVFHITLAAPEGNPRRAVAYPDPNSPAPSGTELLTMSDSVLGVGSTADDYYIEILNGDDGVDNLLEELDALKEAGLSTVESQSNAVLAWAKRNPKSFTYYLMHGKPMVEPAQAMDIDDLDDLRSLMEQDPHFGSPYGNAILALINTINKHKLDPDEATPINWSSGDSASYARINELNFGIRNSPLTFIHELAHAASARVLHFWEIIVSMKTPNINPQNYGELVDAVIAAPPASAGGPPQAVKNLYILYKHAIRSQGMLNYLYAEGSLPTKGELQEQLELHFGERPAPSGLKYDWVTKGLEKIEERKLREDAKTSVFGATISNEKKYTSLIHQASRDGFHFHYGFVNIQEFISEFFSNAMFRRMLKYVPGPLADTQLTHPAQTPPDDTLLNLSTTLSHLWDATVGVSDSGYTPITAEDRLPFTGEVISTERAEDTEFKGLMNQVLSETLGVMKEPQASPQDSLARLRRIVASLPFPTPTRPRQRDILRSDLGARQSRFGNTVQESTENFAEAARDVVIRSLKNKPLFKSLGVDFFINEDIDEALHNLDEKGEPRTHTINPRRGTDYVLTWDQGIQGTSWWRIMDSAYNPQGHKVPLLRTGKYILDVNDPTSETIKFPLPVAETVVLSPRQFVIKAANYREAVYIADNLPPLDISLDEGVSWEDINYPNHLKTPKVLFPFIDRYMENVSDTPPRPLRSDLGATPYWLTPTVEARYLKLAKNPKKNRKALQKLVDRMASWMGYTIQPVYHGSRYYEDPKTGEVKGGDFDEFINTPMRQLQHTGINVPNIAEDTYYFSTNKEYVEEQYGPARKFYLKTGKMIEANSFGGRRAYETHGLEDEYVGRTDYDRPFALMMAKMGRRGEGSRRIYGVYTTPDPDIRVNDKGFYQRNQNKKGGFPIKDADSIVNRLEGHGYTEKQDQFVIFDNRRAKLADPVTYDANGDVIPLSERFNERTSKLRYSDLGFSVDDIGSKHRRYMELAKDEEANREELQRMVDERAELAGYTIPVYHGTKRPFTVFESKRPHSFGLMFFSLDREFAETWPRGTGGHRDPEPDVTARIDKVREESHSLYDKLSAEAKQKYGKEAIENAYKKDSPKEMSEVVDGIFEQMRAYERERLDGMTASEARMSMGIRVIEGRIKAEKVFDPTEGDNWREFLPELLKYLDLKTEEELSPESLRYIKTANYFYWENEVVQEAVFKKYDALLIKESQSDATPRTIAIKDNTLIKSTEPVTRYTKDDGDVIAGRAKAGDIIPLGRRFGGLWRTETQADDIRFSDLGTDLFGYGTTSATDRTYEGFGFTGSLAHKEAMVNKLLPIMVGKLIKSDPDTGDAILNADGDTIIPAGKRLQVADLVQIVGEYVDQAIASKGKRSEMSTTWWGMRRWERDLRMAFETTRAMQNWAGTQKPNRYDYTPREEHNTFNFLEIAMLVNKATNNSGMNLVGHERISARNMLRIISGDVEEDFFRKEGWGDWTATREDLERVEKLYFGSPDPDAGTGIRDHVAKYKHLAKLLLEHSSEDLLDRPVRIRPDRFFEKNVLGSASKDYINARGATTANTLIHEFMHLATLEGIERGSMDFDTAQNVGLFNATNKLKGKALKKRYEDMVAADPTSKLGKLLSVYLHALEHAQTHLTSRKGIPKQKNVFLGFTKEMLQDIDWDYSEAGGEATVPPTYDESQVTTLRRDANKSEEQQEAFGVGLTLPDYIRKRARTGKSERPPNAEITMGADGTYVTRRPDESVANTLPYDVWLPLSAQKRIANRNVFEVIISNPERVDQIAQIENAFRRDMHGASVIMTDNPLVGEGTQQSPARRTMRVRFRIDDPQKFFTRNQISFGASQHKDWDKAEIGIWLPFGRVPKGPKEVTEFIRETLASGTTQMPSNYFYGLQNIKEFVTESFENPEFQEFLASIPSPFDPNKNLWQTFVEAIKSMMESFGIPIDSIRGTLLEDAITASMDMGVASEGTTGGGTTLLPDGKLVFRRGSPNFYHDIPYPPAEPERRSDLGGNLLLSDLGDEAGVISGYEGEQQPIKVDKLSKMLEAPVFETGVYDKPRTTFWEKVKAAFTGDLDIRARRMFEQREAFNRAVRHDLELRAIELKNIVERDFVKKGKKVPSKLISDATGSTAVIVVGDDTRESLAKNLERAEKDIEERAAKGEIDSTQKKQELADAQQKHKDDMEAAETLVRDAIRRKRDAAITQLKKDSPELIEKLGDLREQVDDLSRTLQRLYGTKVDLSTKIDANLGIYLTRSYRMFNEAGWTDRVLTDEGEAFEKIRNNAVSFFEKQYRASRQIALTKSGLSENEAKAQVDKELRDNAMGKQMMFAFLHGYKDGSSLLSGKSAAARFASPLVDQLREKKELDPAIRALLGEYGEDTGFNNLLRTYMNVGLMASNQAFMRNLLDVGRNKENKWILTEEELAKLAVEDPKKYGGDRYSLIKAGGEREYDPFRNVEVEVDGKMVRTKLYAPTEMVEGLTAALAPSNVLDPDKMGGHQMVAHHTMRVAARISGISLGAKTLGSIGFFIRNVLSNLMFFGPAQGFVQYGAMSKSLVSEVRRRFARLTPEDVSEYHRELIMLDVIGNEIRPKLIDELLRGTTNELSLFSEVDQVLNSLQDKEDSEAPVAEKVKAKAKASKESALKGVEKLKTLSSVVDAFFKIALYEHELKYLMDARADSKRNNRNDEYQSMSDYDLKRKAAEKVVMTAQSYSQAPPAVTGAQESWFGVMFAPFLRFKAEMPRILFNTWTLGLKEVRSKNPIIKKRGRRRMVGLTTTVGGMSVALPIAIKAMLGIDDEEDEAMRDSMPEFLRTHTLFYRKDADGKTYSYDLTYLNPFAMLVDPFLRSAEYMNRGDFSRAGSIFAESLIDQQYMDEQIFAGAFINWKRNFDPESGKPIVEENDSAYDAFYKKMMYLVGEGFAPRTPEALWKAGVSNFIQGEFDQDTVSSVAGQLINEFKAVKPHEVNLEAQLNSFLRLRKGEYDRMNGRKNAMFTDDAMTTGDVQELARNEIKHRRRVNEHILKVFKGYEKMGLSMETISQIAIDSGMSKNRMTLLRFGLMDRPALSIDFIERMAGRGATHVQRLKDFQAELDKEARYISLDPQ